MRGIVFGCVVPHPPLLVPEVGRGQERAIATTTQAMMKLSDALSQQHLDSMVIISPHGISRYNAMGVVTAISCSGNLRQWGVQNVEYHFANDLDFVSALIGQAEKSHIPLKSIGDKEYELDHGVMVPMYFLVKGGKGLPLVPLTFSWLPLSTHFAFGKVVREAAEQTGKRVAVIASGDLSHRLLPNAPAGYDPWGEVFDHKLVDALATLDTVSILNLKPELIERAGECGLRSIVILLGALEGLSVKPQVLSYEGPFGVGYLVACFRVEATPLEKAEEVHPLVKIAKDAVETYVKEGKTPKPRQSPPELTPQRAGVFVCLKMHGELRGCIGTFDPTQPSIVDETIANAISSAIHDPRFPPVNEAELPYLSYSVDVLTKPEPVDSLSQLNPKRYGVIVESRGRRGLLLPDLEGVDTVEQQIEICRRKAGISPQEPVKLHRFEVKRYT